MRGVSFGHVESALPLQAADVVLGSIRYCMEKPDHNVSVELTGALSEFSGLLEPRPWKVKVARYAQDYDEFRQDWRELGDRFKADQQPDT